MPPSTRKPPARKPTSATPIRKAGPDKIHFSLDTFEKEKVYELFTADLGDRPVAMIDPEDLEFDALAAIDNPVEFLDLCMSEEDREYVYSLHLKAWQVNGLMDAYMAHYGIGDRGKGGA